MNKERRKEIKSIADRLMSIQVDVTSVLAEEQSAFDNMPEGLQESAAGEASDEAIGMLEEAEGMLQDIIDILEELWQG